MVTQRFWCLDAGAQFRYQHDLLLAQRIIMECVMFSLTREPSYIIPIASGVSEVNLGVGLPAHASSWGPRAFHLGSLDIT